MTSRSNSSTHLPRIMNSLAHVRPHVRLLLKRSPMSTTKQEHTSRLNHRSMNLYTHRGPRPYHLQYASSPQDRQSLHRMSQLARVTPITLQIWTMTPCLRLNHRLRSKRMQMAVAQAIFPKYLPLLLKKGPPLFLPHLQECPELLQRCPTCQIRPSCLLPHLLHLVPPQRLDTRTLKHLLSFLRRRSILPSRPCQGHRSMLLDNPTQLLKHLRVLHIQVNTSNSRYLRTHHYSYSHVKRAKRPLTWQTKRQS